MVNFVYTLVGTLFIQMWSIFIHLRVIYTIVVDVYKFEGSFIHLWEFIHLRVQQGLWDSWGLGSLYKHKRINLGKNFTVWSDVVEFFCA